MTTTRKTNTGETSIEAARESAREAIAQGATAPWGDGDVAPHITFPDHDTALAYDKAFRAAIDAEAPALRSEE